MNAQTLTTLGTLVAIAVGAMTIWGILLQRKSTLRSLRDAEEQQERNIREDERTRMQPKLDTLTLRLEACQSDLEQLRQTLLERTAERDEMRRQLWQLTQQQINRRRDEGT